MPIEYLVGNSGLWNIRLPPVKQVPACGYTFETFYVVSMTSPTLSSAQISEVAFYDRVLKMVQIKTVNYAYLGA